MDAKIAVDAIFVGRERAYNRRFQQMCSHYLVEPVACSPASGWEKGQVENQVGTVRQRFFSPRVKMKSYDELNAWLADRCAAWAKAHRHPEHAELTIWEAFEAERPSLVPYRGPFDGFHAVPAAVSKTCLVRFDSNRYSVSASAVGRPVEIRAYAERIELRQDGRVVGEHRRAFGRGKTVYDPWHYVPVLARKPGALEGRRALQGLGAAGTRSSASAASSGARRTATGRWSRSSAPCWATGSRPWRRPAPRPSPRASTRRT